MESWRRIVTVELDHLFIFTGDGASEADLLVDFGLSEGASNTHPGQGTSNRRFFFGNAMLELLWVHDEREARSPAISPLRLWERWRHLSTGYSPFGVCFRPSADHTPGQPILPLATREFRPPYLPTGSHIEVAVDTAGIEPLIFALPFGVRPDLRQPRQSLDHPAGLGEITGLEITLPSPGPISEALRALGRTVPVTFQTGPGHLAEVEFDRGSRKQCAEFRPHLPLRIRW